MIADRLGCAPEQVVVGSGGAGVIMMTVRVPLQPDSRQDLAAFAAAVDERRRLVMACNPHNPTGTLVTADELAVLLSAVDPAVPVLLDEAYIGFVTPPHRRDELKLVDRYPNLLIVRTFSEACGLAELRERIDVIAPGTGSAGHGAVTARFRPTSQPRQLPVPVASGASDTVRTRSALAAAGIAVKSYSEGTRITVGHSAATDAVVAALAGAAD